MTCCKCTKYDVDQLEPNMLPPVDTPFLFPQREPHRRVTAGELRSRLQELGDPWIVDPRLADDDLIPNYSNGGSLEIDLTAIVVLDGDVTGFIQELSPDNPFLRAYWFELGWLSLGDLSEEWVSTNPDETIEPMAGEES